MDEPTAPAPGTSHQTGPAAPHPPADPLTPIDLLLPGAWRDRPTGRTGRHAAPETPPVVIHHPPTLELPLDELRKLAP